MPDIAAVQREVLQGYSDWALYLPAFSVKTNGCFSAVALIRQIKPVCLTATGSYRICTCFPLGFISNNDIQYYSDSSFMIAS